MASTDVKQIYEELDLIKNDLSVIKHILSEEGKLTANAKKRLEAGRKIPLSQYIKL